MSGEGGERLGAILKEQVAALTAAVEWAHREMHTGPLESCLFKACQSAQAGIRNLPAAFALPQGEPQKCPHGMPESYPDCCWPAPQGEERLREALKRWGPDLIRYVVAQGGVHDDDCPCDDTCSCSGKPLNDAANAVCALAQEPRAEGEGQEKRCEKCGSTAGPHTCEPNWPYAEPSAVRGEEPETQTTSNAASLNLEWTPALENLQRIFEDRLAEMSAEEATAAIERILAIPVRAEGEQHDCPSVRARIRAEWEKPALPLIEHAYLSQGAWDCCWQWMGGTVADPYSGRYCRQPRAAHQAAEEGGE